jgi:hypothetical protein
VDKETTSQELTNNKTVVLSCEGLQDLPSLSENSKSNNYEDTDKTIRIYNLLDTDREQTVSPLVSGEGNLLNKNLTTNDKPVETQAPEETSKL